MKAIKGLLIYVCILIALAFVGATLLFCGGFFFGLEIGGYGVVKNLNTQVIPYNIQSTASDALTCDMKINAGNYNIRVEALNTDSTTKYVSMLYKNNAFGIYCDGDKETLVTASYSNGTITINIEQPSGFIAFNDSYLTVYVPNTTTINNLYINTEDGNVELAGSTSTTNYGTLNIKNLSVTTSKGDFTTTKGVRPVEGTSRFLCFESLSFTTDSGTINFGNQAVAVGTMIKTADYTYTLSNVGKLRFNGDDAVLQLGEVYGELSIDGDNLLITIDKLYTVGKEFKYDSEKGTLNIENIYSTRTSRESSGSLSDLNPSVNFSGINEATMGGVSITTESANLNFKNVTGDVYVKTTHGNVYIQSALDTDGEVDITTEHGNITIDKVMCNVLADTTYGEIKIAEYYKSAYLINRYGRTTANYKGSTNFALDADGAPQVITKAVSTDGDIYLTGISTYLELTGKEKTNAFITFASIPSSSTNWSDEAGVKAGRAHFDINTNKGKIDMKLQSVTNPIILNVQKGDGSISGKVNMINVNNASSVQTFVQPSSGSYIGMLFNLNTSKGSITVSTNA